MHVKHCCSESCTGFRLIRTLLKPDLRNARPATGIQTPKPEIPRKKLKTYPPGPDPNSLNKPKKYQNTRKLCFWEFLVFFMFFFKAFGVRGIIFELISRNFGFGGFGSL